MQNSAEFRVREYTNFDIRILHCIVLYIGTAYKLLTYISYRMIFSEKYAKRVRTYGLRSKQKFPFLTPTPSPPLATEALNAYRVLKVMIIAQVNLFYAVTPD